MGEDNRLEGLPPQGLVEMTSLRRWQSGHRYAWLKSSFKGNMGDIGSDMLLDCEDELDFQQEARY
jgi:hypothetical protein